MTCPTCGSDDHGVCNGVKGPPVVCRKCGHAHRDRPCHEMVKELECKCEAYEPRGER